MSYPFVRASTGTPVLGRVSLVCGCAAVGLGLFGAVLAAAGVEGVENDALVVVGLTLLAGSVAVAVVAVATGIMALGPRHRTGRTAGPVVGLVGGGLVLGAGLLVLGLLVAALTFA